MARQYVPSLATIVATLALAGLAWAGNAAHVSLFFGVDLIFGSVFALVALVWLGPVAGLLVALAGGLFTLDLWGHPYAMLIGLLEVAVVWRLLWRGWFLALGDALFWLVVGGPLAFLLYAGPLGMDTTAASLIALKQPVNGLINALLASLLVLVLQWHFRLHGTYLPERIRLRDLLFGLFLAMALLPGLILVVVEGWGERDHRETALAQQMALVAQSAHPLANRVANGQSASPHRGETGRFLLLPVWAWADPLRRLGVPTFFPPPGWQSTPTPVTGLTLVGPANAGLPDMERWARAFYLSHVAHSQGGTVTVLTPASELVAGLRSQYRNQLLVLALLGLASALVAGLLSRWLTRPLNALTTLAEEVPGTIARHEDRPFFPRSRIADFERLMNTLEVMTRTLGQSIRESEAARAELDERVRERTARLEYHNDQLKRLATVAAHHLQEPVRRANIAFQLVQRDPAGHGSGWEHLEESLGRLSRLNTALHRYLAYLIRDPVREAVDLDALVTQARKEVEREQECPLVLTRGPDPLPTIRADAAMLTEAFRQVFLNVINFTDGYGRPTAHISAETRSEHWTLRLTDCGPGIDPAYRDRIFRLFEQLPPASGELTGTGVGLALVAQIAEAHGGTAHAEAGADGTGTSIVLVLPGGPDGRNHPTTD